MAVVCPTVTAFEPHTYREQMERLEPFASRVHIDLMDGEFAPTKSPGLEQVWWPPALTADIHLMYERPADRLDMLVKLKPSLVVIHAEADVDHMDFASRLHAHGIKAGLALLQPTAVEQVSQIIHSFDHVLVFSGDLGKHGGILDERILYKVQKVKRVHPEAEISWDGGINEHNARRLIDSGVEVLNVGGFIQKAPNPAEAYEKLTNMV